MRHLRLKAALTSILLAALACTPGLPSSLEGSATDPAQPTAHPAFESLPPMDQLDFEDPPDWLQEILANQATAPESDPAQLEVQLDPETSVSQTFGERGGSLELTGTEGVAYRLEIPEGALLSEAEITMTEVALVENAAADGESLAAVDLQPEALVLLKPALLRVELPGMDDQTGYLGFGASGDGQNAHALMAVEVDGGFELSLPHFSMAGTVSARHSNNARLLYEAIRNSVPNGAAEYYRQDIAQHYADWLDGKLSQEQFTQNIIRDKREWFWRSGDGVYYSLLDGAVRTVEAETNRFREPHLLERAIAHYLEWTQIERVNMHDYFNTLGEPFPFQLEEDFGDRLITQGIKEGLEAGCISPIDALYKIRIYRLGLALQSGTSDHGVDPYSATSFPDFTQASALEKVQDCANFKLTYSTYLSLALPTRQWQEIGSVQELPYIYDENFEVKVFRFDAPSEHWQSRVSCEGYDGFITFSDMRWPLNIFRDPDVVFQEQPLEVRLSVVEAPAVMCGALPLPPFWVLNRMLTCPLRFELDVAGRIDQDNANFAQQYTCEFTDPKGNKGVIQDEIFLDHNPQFSLFD